MSSSDPRALRVALNGYFRCHPLTGSGQYLASLYKALDGMPSCTPELFCPDERGRAVAGNPLHPHAVSPFAKVFFEQVALPAAAGAFDLVHYPYWAAPLRAARPVVVTVHDLIPLLLPRYRGSLAVRAYTSLVGVGTRRAALIVADSISTKKDLVAYLGLPSERVRVIYLAPDERFRAAADPSPEAAVRRKYGLDGAFVFYVGGLDCRKNVELLISAFGRALPSLAGRPVLAIAGDAGRRGPLFSDLPALGRRLGLTDSLRFLGVVPEQDLPALYHAASAFAYPSRYEGFGLPPLEALACASPVLCSRASSLPEIVGDAAMLLDPDDEQAWAGALARVLADGDLAAAMRRRGPPQAARFTWLRVATETAAVYQEAVERFRRQRVYA